MTEDQIERRVEVLFDHLDALLMAGQLTQEQYDANARDVAAWADHQLTHRGMQS